MGHTLQEFCHKNVSFPFDSCPFSKRGQTSSTIIDRHFLTDSYAGHPFIPYFLASHFFGAKFWSNRCSKIWENFWCWLENPSSRWSNNGKNEWFFCPFPKASKDAHSLARSCNACCWLVPTSTIHAPMGRLPFSVLLGVMGNEGIALLPLSQPAVCLSISAYVKACSPNGVICKMFSFRGKVWIKRKPYHSLRRSLHRICPCKKNLRAFPT